MRVWLFNNEVKQQFEINVRQNAKWFYLDGIMFIVLGLLAILSPVLAAEFFDVFIGLLLLITGASQLAFNLASRRPWTYYLAGTMAVIVGVLMLANPHAGILALAALLTMLFFVQGCMQIASVGLYYPNPGWGWLLASGIITLLLAMIIFSGWPVTAVWILAVILGVNLASIGFSIIMLTKAINK